MAIQEDSSSDIGVVSAAMFPGFRFAPTDDELVSHYLKRKIKGLDLSGDVIAEVDFCKSEPWDLPAKSIIQSDHEWFFFSSNGKKYPKGSQAKRGTESGFWKATGKERDIKSGKNVIGTKRTLVFHLGRAPKGKRTGWMMHEYCLRDNKDGKSQDSYVICRLRKKQKSGSDKGLSAQSNTLRCTSDVGSELQQLERSAEDDCFADILNDDIIKLEENQSSNSVSGYSVVCKSNQLVCSFKSRGLPFQGTAHRRIGLGRLRFRRKCEKMHGGGGKYAEEDVMDGDGDRPKHLPFSEKLLLLCEGWRLFTIFVTMVLIVMLLCCA